MLCSYCKSEVKKVNTCAGCGLPVCESRYCSAKGDNSKSPKYVCNTCICKELDESLNPLDEKNEIKSKSQ